MTPSPERHPRDGVRDLVMARLSDQDLDAYIRQWSANVERYRSQATTGGPHRPGEKGPAFSAWWADKILDRGMREQARRRQLANTPPPSDATHPTARKGEQP